MFNNILTIKEKIGKIGLHHILEQNHQKRQKIQNFKISQFLLILSIFINRKTLNVEYICMKIQYNLIFENKKKTNRNRPNFIF
jgi:hypothetical protein